MERDGMEVVLGMAQAAAWLLAAVDLYLLWQWPFDDPYRDAGIWSDTDKETGASEGRSRR